MGHEVACSCGKVLPASEDMAGSSILCSCGCTVHVPPQSRMEGQAVTDAVPGPAADLQSPAAPARRAEAAEIIAPTPSVVRLGHGGPPGRPRSVMVALTAEAVWIQDAWLLRQIPLPTCNSIDALKNGKELLLTLCSEPSAERLTLKFESAAMAHRWCGELQAQARATRPRPAPQATGPSRKACLSCGRRRTFRTSPWAGSSSRIARRGRRIGGFNSAPGCAGPTRSSSLKREKCPDLGWGGARVSGLAIRVEDPAARQRLRLRWYGEEVSGLVKRVLLLLVLQAALLFLSAVFCTGVTALSLATGETLPQALASAGLGLGLVFAWPLVLLWPAVGTALATVPSHDGAGGAGGDDGAWTDRVAGPSAGRLDYGGHVRCGQALDSGGPRRLGLCPRRGGAVCPGLAPGGQRASDPAAGGADRFDSAPDLVPRPAGGDRAFTPWLSSVGSGPRYQASAICSSRGSIRRASTKRSSRKRGGGPGATRGPRLRRSNRCNGPCRSGKS